eukprot:maker-scaffold395_size185061-snap-gene-0.36 protein:Tk08344 transcript:maker-scaffold395_size185061-snap-gene-0.36-mRNA-1 annotation:"39s ribosomal protein mitochondrial"
MYCRCEFQAPSFTSDSLGGFTLDRSMCSATQIGLRRDPSRKARMLWPVAQSWFHSSPQRCDIMEFFEKEDNWGKNKVYVGRSWLKDELRLRGNEELHKLWYVLLKERNRLLTLEHLCKQEVLPMPNEERLDKVDISMENLEEVVRERNRAYWELEVGESGEQERQVLEDSTFAMEEEYITQEHTVPFELNEEHREMYKQRFWTGLDDDSRVFYRRMREQAYQDMKQKKYRDMRDGARVLRRFPNVDEEALQEKYPNASVEEMKRYKDALGNRANLSVDF